MNSAGSRSPLKIVCLVGFMGCGKTTVGRLLAQQLGWRFVDLDERIEKQAGLQISAIFERMGEPAFRQLERAELVRGLGEAAASATPAVLALGGGTFAQPENIEIIRTTCIPITGPRIGGSVWLDCPFQLLVSRCVTMSDRPLFRDETGFRKLYEERLPFYQQADARIEGGDAPRNVVERILTSEMFTTPKVSA